VKAMGEKIISKITEKIEKDKKSATSQYGEEYDDEAHDDWKWNDH
jgi:hypothetical protein